MVTLEANFPYIDSGACFYDGYLGMIASSQIDQHPQITSISNPEGQVVALMNGANISALVNTTDNVDTNTVGKYYVSYTITNAMSDFATWDTTTCRRTVTVVDTLKPVISLLSQNQRLTAHTTPDVSTSDIPFINPAQHFAVNPGGRAAVDYDSMIELGAAPYLSPNPLNPHEVLSYQQCQERCKEMPTCMYGTYVTAGVRDGQCWLSATTTKLSRACGMPCKSFIVVEDNSLDSQNSQFRRRLAPIANMRRGNSNSGESDRLLQFHVALPFIAMAIVGVAVWVRR
jgi:hypothetical protein